MHAESPELRAALVAGGGDPNLLIDKEGNTLLHKAESPEQIVLLLQNSLSDLSMMNKVQSLNKFFTTFYFTSANDLLQLLAHEYHPLSFDH